ncbi:putative DNA-binding domain-containing protein [Asticcacaulis sp.]|uniref:HvfC/BufC family peptide modification chaperone n=1 Tax=Asticcacaulis sp. TaxID=1872648 RepID=UPI00391AB9A1
MSAFHQAFAGALAGDTDALAAWLETPERPTVAVYRNTIMSGLVEALEAAFPAVVAALGSDNFHQVAAAFARDQYPAHPMLHDYGGGFADWLAAQDALSDMDWLPDLARLDHLRLGVLNAADVEATPAEVFARLSPEALSQARARLIPSARLIRFDTTLMSVWDTLLTGDGEGLERRPEPEALLVRRVGEGVEVRCLTPEVAAFLSVCAEGGTLTEAAEAAMASDPACDLTALFSHVLGLSCLHLSTERNSL